MYCMHCGAQITDGAHFCSECGKRQVQQNNQPVATEYPAPEAAGTRRGKKQRRKRRRPIYERKWFWAVIAVLVFFIIVSTGKGNDTAPVDSQAKISDSNDLNDSNRAETDEATAPPESLEIESSEKGVPIDTSLNPVSPEETRTLPAPLSDFWITLGADHTITLNSFDKHDKICIIPSSYTIDGETWYVKHIGGACFFGRTSLEYLVIPEGVESIEHNAFNSCTVKEMYLPSTLVNIEGIFEYLDHSRLTIYYAGNADDWWSIQGAAGITDNIELIGETPVPAVTDDRNYGLAELTTEKSQAEQLGGSLGNAFNGFFQGLSEGLEEDEDSGQ